MSNLREALEACLVQLEQMEGLVDGDEDVRKAIEQGRKALEDDMRYEIFDLNWQSLIRTDSAQRCADLAFDRVPCISSDSRPGVAYPFTVFYLGCGHVIGHPCKTTDEVERALTKLNLK